MVQLGIIKQGNARFGALNHKLLQTCLVKIEIGETRIQRKTMCGNKSDIDIDFVEKVLSEKPFQRTGIFGNNAAGHDDGDIGLVLQGHHRINSVCDYRKAAKPIQKIGKSQRRGACVQDNTLAVADMAQCCLTDLRLLIAVFPFSGVKVDNVAFIFNKNRSAVDFADQSLFFKFQEIIADGAGRNLKMPAQLLGCNSFIALQ